MIDLSLSRMERLMAALMASAWARRRALGLSCEPEKRALSMAGLLDSLRAQSPRSQVEQYMQRLY
jgi:hypothetical protein